MTGISARMALALATSTAVSACSGGGTSAVHVPMTPTKTVSAQLAIVIPLPTQQTAGRGTRFVSVATASGGIALGPVTQNFTQTFDLSATSPNCSSATGARTCRFGVDLPLGSVTINLLTFDGPLSGGRPSGHQLAVASSTQTIVEGRLNAVTLSLLGLPATATVVPQQSTISALGRQVTVPLTVTVFDASGNQITGVDKFAQPVTFSAQGANGAFTTFNFVVNGNPTTGALTSPTDTVALVYGGSGGTGSYSIVASTNSGNTQLGSAPFTIQPGFALVQQIFSSLANADIVQRYDNRDIWLTVPVAHKIVSISASGTYTEFPVASGKEPRHIVYTGVNGVFPGAGKPFVVTELPDTIGFLQTNGSIAEVTVPTANAGLGGIDFDAGNFRLWFAESAGKIGMATLSGTITEFPTGVAGSTPAAVARNCLSGAILFTDPGTNAIGSMKTSDHTVVEFPIPTANAGPSAIVCANTNDSWFTEANAAKLGHFDNFTGAIVEYPAPDVLVSIVAALADGSNATVWALTRGGVVVKFGAAGQYVTYPVTLGGNGTPAVLTQGYSTDLLILRNGVSISDLDAMYY